MAALNVNQPQVGTGDRLSFGAESEVGPPDRLLAALSPAPVWSRRVRVLLAAGVLVVSVGGTGTSVASEPDDQQEGVVAPDPGDGPPGNDPVDQETGPSSGGETVLPYEVEPVLSGPGGHGPGDQSPDAGPIEIVPVEDPDGPSLLSAPQEIGPGGPSDTPAPPADSVPPAEPVPTAPLTPPTAPLPEPRQSPPELSPQPGERGGRTSPGQPGKDRPARQDAPKRGANGQGGGQSAPKQGGAGQSAPDQDGAGQSAPEQDGAGQSAPEQGGAGQDTAEGGTWQVAADDAGGDLAAGSAPANGTAAAAHDAPAAPTPQLRHRHFHVVQPGESLWSIATAILGPDASPAAITREVRRLWRLNKARIGTGDPSLLPAGVRLRLR